MQSPVVCYNWGNNWIRHADMKRTTFGLLLITLIAPHQPAWSGGWGRVFAVEVRSDSFSEPLVISDSAIVDELSFWVGPGTGYREFIGPVSLERSIVDWQRGEATNRPAGLASYEVRFLLEPRADPPVYIVLYQPAPDDREGYIYYTGKGSSIVSHRVSGTWRYASARWNARVGAAISEYIDRSVSAEQ